MVTRRAEARRGLSLLEVLVALAVFLISYIAIWELMNLSGKQALTLSYRNQATQLAQAKLAEVTSGVVPLSGQGDTAFEDEYDAPNYTYAIDISDGAVSTLKVVTVTVTRTGQDGSTVKVKVSQMMLDPTAVGSTQDVQPLTPSTSSASG